MSRGTALITGGTSGIGRATAELLHARGDRVVVTGQSERSVERARDELPDDVLVVRADARSARDTESLMQTVGERFGSLDTVFLNAGTSRSQPVGSVDQASFDDLVDVNFKGQFFTLQSALGLLADGASITVTVGVGIAHGMPGRAVTAATRGALLAMVPTLALELAPRRIRVNAISPGAIDTPIWERLGVPEQARTALAERIPFGRFGSADEVAGLVAFLASDAAAYITAQHIAVAGGIGLGA